MTRRGFALSLAATCSLSGQNAGARGKQLAGRVIEALGGDAFRNLRTRTESGRAYSFYRDQLSGLSIARIYTRYVSPPFTGTGQAQRQVFGKKLDDAIIFTGSDAWEVTYRGAKPIAPERVKQFHESALTDVFYILRQRMDEPGLEFESRGADVVENQPVETLQIFDSEHREITVWVNATTFLPTKQRFYRWDKTINDRREEVTRYSKYRDVGDGVMWPFSTERDRDTEKLFQLYSEHVTINEPLSDSLFALPGGVKILKP